MPSVTIFGKGGQGVYSVQRKVRSCCCCYDSSETSSNADAEWSGGDDDFLVIRAFRTSNFISPHFELIFFRWVETVLKPPTSLSLTCAHTSQPSKCFFCAFQLQDLDGKLQVIEADTAEQQRKVQSLEGLGICLVFIRFMAGWWCSDYFFYSHPYLGEMIQFDLTNIFQMGWNHQLDEMFCFGGNGLNFWG